VQDQREAQDLPCQPQAGDVRLLLISLPFD
jgi:hypothetical protein